MAAESVIVQVEKEEEVTTTPLSTASTTSKKIKAPNFFRKLFCCLRPHNHRHTVQAAQNGAPINQITLLDHLTINEIVVDQSNEVALLKSVTTDFEDKQCLVIDLDETLVHSSFAPVQNADFTIPVEIDGTVHQVYVSKRPYVDEFLQHVGRLFECVLFTASLGKYADPVTDLLDKWGCFKHRLFRESCVFHRGSYVKDLSRLGRDVNNTVILDNSPASYMFHPKHAVPIPSWFDDQNDTSLLELMVFFERMATSSLKAVDFLRENDVQGEHLELFTGEPAPHDSDTDSIIHTTQTSNSIITSVTSPTS